MLANTGLNVYRKGSIREFGMKRILAKGTILALAGVLYTFSGTASFAMGDGGSSGGNSGTPTTSAPT